MRTLGKDSNLGLPHILGLLPNTQEAYQTNASDREYHATTVECS